MSLILIGKQKLLEYGAYPPSSTALTRADNSSETRQSRKRLVVPGCLQGQ